MVRAEQLDLFAAPPADPVEWAAPCPACGAMGGAPCLPVQPERLTWTHARRVLDEVER